MFPLLWIKSIYSIKKYRYILKSDTFLFNFKNNEIKISLKKEANKLKLEVTDNGIGIPNNEIKNVMKRFYKVDKSRVNNNSFGIGLSIANRIVNNYDAKIYLDSKVNEYTSINVYFK